MAEINPAEIKIDVFGGPAAGHGFRNGTWKASYKGREFSFFASVPHGAELDEQRRILQTSAARHLDSAWGREFNFYASA